MATYTNESLEKTNKRDMINIVLSLQSKLDEANNRVVEEVRKLSDAFLKLQSELAVSKQVNSLLSNRLTNMERQCWANAQYSRRECLDVVEDFKLPGQNKLFINRSLCPYYKVLCSKSKKLHSLGKIFSFYISGDTIKIKVSENSSSLSITHVDDFGKYFPDIDLSPPERSE